MSCAYCLDGTHTPFPIITNRSPMHAPRSSNAIITHRLRTGSDAKDGAEQPRPTTSTSPTAQDAIAKLEALFGPKPAKVGVTSVLAKGTEGGAT